jgi:hypothetical protein
MYTTILDMRLETEGSGTPTNVPLRWMLCLRDRPTGRAYVRCFDGHVLFHWKTPFLPLVTHLSAASKLRGVMVTFRCGR